MLKHKDTIRCFSCKFFVRRGNFPCKENICQYYSAEEKVVTQNYLESCKRYNWRVVK